MEKEDVLLKNFSILSKNPLKHKEALWDLIAQMVEINPNVAIKCWEELIKNHLEELRKDFYLEEYDSDIDDVLVQEMDYRILKKEEFKNAIPFFIKSKFLLDIIFSKLPISKYTSIHYPISYCIKNDDLKSADIMLSYVYKNKKFNDYSKLWREIIKEFEYSDLEHYSGGGTVSDLNYKKPEHIQNFCVSWIQRITDEEEQAGAMTHAMRLF